MPEVAVASPPGDELGSSAFVSEQPDPPRFVRQRVRDIYDEVRRRATKKQPTSHDGDVEGAYSLQSERLGLRNVQKFSDTKRHLCSL